MMPWQTPRLLGRFWNKVEVPANGSACWVWVSSKDGKGYGSFSVNGRYERAHRVSYEMHRGPISRGLVIDHLCRNPACVNPWHLEPVARIENIRRAYRPRATCKRGHPMTTANTKKGADGKWRCLECIRQRDRDRWQARKARRAGAGEVKGARDAAIPRDTAFSYPVRLAGRKRAQLWRERRRVIGPGWAAWLPGTRAWGSIPPRQPGPLSLSANYPALENTFRGGWTRGKPANPRDKECDGPRRSTAPDSEGLDVRLTLESPSPYPERMR